MAAVHIIMAIGAYGCKTGLAEENGKGDFMEKREETIRLWFDMWLKKCDLGILDTSFQVSSDKGRLKKQFI